MSQLDCPYPTYPFRLEDFKDSVLLDIDMYYCFYMPGFYSDTRLELMLPCGLLIENKRINGWKTTTGVRINLEHHKEAVYLGICVLHRKL